MFQEEYGGDGMWMFAEVTENKDGTHDVTLVEITDVIRSGAIQADEVGREGAYMAEGASWWPIENVTRDERIRAVGNDRCQDSCVSLLVDDAAYIADRRKLRGWDVELAERLGYTEERIDHEEHALRLWADESIVRRAEILMAYYGGDTVGYGNGWYTTLADAMHAAGVPRSALSDPAPYDDDPNMRDGWGEECAKSYTHHVWPRERHARELAKLMQEAWMADDHERAEDIQKHLIEVIDKLDTEEYTPDWYAGHGIYDESYTTLMDATSEE